MMDEWHKTEIGILFIKFENACAAMWREDNNDHISDKRLRELDERLRAARENLINAIKTGSGA